MSDVSEHPGCRECRNYSLRGPEYCAFCETDDLRQQLATLTQERDALREAVKKLVEAGDAMYTRGTFNDFDYLAVTGWAAVTSDLHALLTPPAGAGNGKEVGK